MGNDRELLEYAAKASGIKTWSDEQGVIRDISELHSNVHPHHARVWNPLTDDGDALRLAVKLGICVGASIHAPYTPGTTAWLYGERINDIHEKHAKDPYAATRRAIVRAAAEIGRQMNGT